MPTKHRIPAAVPLTPAAVWLAMSGAFPGTAADDETPDPATAGLAGWCALLQDVGHRDTLRAGLGPLLAAHGDTLRAMAAAAGFRPWCETQQSPTGPAFARWRRAFLVTHGVHVGGTTIQ
jgi:hypothetical protein